MDDLSYLSDRIAAQRIEERVQYAERARIPGRPRRTTRNTIARGLHRLADRLEA